MSQHDNHTFISSYFPKMYNKRREYSKCWWARLSVLQKNYYSIMYATTERCLKSTEEFVQLSLNVEKNRQE